MIGLLELAGYAIVGGCLLQVGWGLAADVRRHAARLGRERAETELFRRRSQELLRAAQAAREKAELSWVGYRKFEVDEKLRECEGVHSFYLRPHDGKPLPPYEAGQHLTFRLRLPGRPVPLVRCYSLSQAEPAGGRYRVTVRRVAPPSEAPDAPDGLCSSYFDAELSVGDIVEVRAPSGHFRLEPGTGTPVVLIGGGIGVTPLLAMLEALVAAGGEREVWLFYGARHGGAHPLRDDLRRLAAEAPGVRVVVCYSAPRDRDRAGIDYALAGRLSVGLIRERLGTPSGEFYLCGPAGMMGEITAGLADWGVPDAAVHYEAFGPATVRERPARASASGPAVQAEVRFERSGKAAVWTPEAGSLLDLAEANGIAIESGCRAGSCGTCLTALRAGTVDYLSSPGVPPEAGSCLSCIAVPQGPVVLDA